MLIPKTKEKILKIFFLNPYVPLYVREVARKTDISTQNAHKYLLDLAEVGFLERKRENNQVFYKPKMDNPFLIKFFELFEIERREAVRAKKKKLRPRIEKLMEKTDRKADFALLYGDEVMIVSDKASIEGAISTSEFQKKVKDPNFLNDLMKKRVVAFGESRFWEAIR